LRKKINNTSPQHFGCGECRVREDMISLLRAQVASLTEMNERMQEKMLMMSGEGAERWHRLKMTEQAHMRPSATEGIVPREDLTLEEDRAVDALIANLQGSFTQ